MVMRQPLTVGGERYYVVWLPVQSSVNTLTPISRDAVYLRTQWRKFNVTWHLSAGIAEKLHGQRSKPSSLLLFFFYFILYPRV